MASEAAGGVVWSETVMASVVRGGVGTFAGTSTLGWGFASCSPPSVRGYDLVVKGGVRSPGSPGISGS